MCYAYKKAGNLTREVNEMIEKVLKNCEVCKENVCSKPKLSVAVSRVMGFNSVVTVDLKIMRAIRILWMICTFIKFIRKVVTNDKMSESIIKGLHRAQCMAYGFTTVGFWVDNGGQFRSFKINEFVNMMGISIEIIYHI